MRLAIALAGVLVLVGVVPALAQSYLLSGEEVAASAGASVSLDLLLTNDSPVRAFSFGFLHDASEIVLLGIGETGVVAAANGGTGADYFFSEIDPDGIPGGTVGVLLSLSPPFSSIPPGVNQPIIELTYQTSAGVDSGTVSTVTYVDQLGTPPIDLIVAAGTVAVVPDTASGAVLFLPTAPVGMTCGLTASCGSTYQVSWTPGESYDFVDVLVDGAGFTTLFGIQTSTTITLSPGTHQICVVGRIGDLASEPTCCTVTVGVLAPSPPTGLSCVVDDTTCEVQLSWNNAAPYVGIDLLADGVLVESLPGSATSVSYAAGSEPVTLCLVAVGLCDDATPVCCLVTCGAAFSRGDCNGDGAFDLGDVITGLNSLFSGAGPTACDDACDGNDDGAFDIADMIFLLNTLFGMGALPPAPYPACGTDTTADGLSCATTCP